MKPIIPFYIDEVREGFFIPGMVKRCWAVQLDILDLVCQICDRHGISWFANYGTLIGAARHNGFVPWDDDLDICMLRDDYDRFLSVAQEELPEGYLVINVYNSLEYNNFLTRITNGSSINISQDYLDSHCGFPYVCGIDVFPLEYLYADPEREEERRTRGKALLDLAESVHDDPKADRETTLKKAEEIAGFPLDHTIPLEPALLRGISDVFRECTSPESGFAASMPQWCRKKRQKYPIDYFKQTALLPFEDTVVRVPVNYAGDLKTVYGHWEVVKKEGGAHGYPYYSDQEKELAKTKGISYQYSFSMKDFGISYEEKTTGEDDVPSLFAVLRKAVNLADSLCRIRNTENLPEILTEVQNIAIKTGTVIEERFGTGTACVTNLENLCESLYELSERAADQDAGLAGPGQMTDLQKAEEAYGELKQQKLVIFFPFRGKYFERLRPYYEECRKKPANRVLVMPIPTYEKKYNGKLVGETLDLEGYPEDLVLQDYRTFDFANAGIDCAVIQNPYDEWNSAISVHPFFYAKNLRKLTKELVYIPYFHVDDFTEKDGKACRNLPYYAVTPGTVCATKILLDSEILREDYIRALTLAAGEDTKEIWEAKILVTPKVENDLKLCKERKPLLFTVSFSEMMEQKEKALEKIQNLIRLFKNKKDELTILWAEDTCFESNMREYLPVIYEELQKLVKDFTDSGCGTYLVSNDGPELTKEADAFYGSPGYLMNLCVYEKKPVMLMNCGILLNE